MKRLGWLAAGTAAIFITATVASLRPPPRLDHVLGASERPLVLDRFGGVLRYSFLGDWNVDQTIAVSDAPPLLVTAILQEEDREFFHHHGVDWKARLSALWLNLRQQRVARGASTIDEQVVRMLHPRPRTYWSKWIEGLEALGLEARNSKSEILQFYLNQVPYADQRRGVVQAARHFFGRDVRTLNPQEILSLAIMIKSPARLSDPAAQVPHIEKLADRLRAIDALTSYEREDVHHSTLAFAPTKLEVEAPHFVAFAESRRSEPSLTALTSTLDPGLQTEAQRLLNESLRTNPQHELENGAVIVADHQTDEVLAWAVGRGPKELATSFDAALVPRQPGSSLKPFLYTLAFENGFSPASLVEDAPMAEGVGAGMHNYRNYSRTHYGWISLREALANSLNIPAIRLVSELGVDVFLDRLRALGITTLTRTAAFYGDGLALGNGEVPLWEMVNGYAALARNGVYRPLRVLKSESIGAPQPVFSEAAASLTGQVLSDPNARRLEFGRGGSMEFPLQTAVKTGTSNDFRDAWAFAYNYKFVIGVWMGNLNDRPTRGLTGSTVPMLIARALMNQAMIGQTPQPLIVSSKLIPRKICREENQVYDYDGVCAPKMEYFLNNDPLPKTVASSEERGFRITKPTPNMNMAWDPRLPARAQAFTFEVGGQVPDQPIQWFINDQLLKETRENKLEWPLAKGNFKLRAKQGNREAVRSFFVR